MIAVDTNVLVYAWREDSPHFDQARELVRRLAEGDEPWALPWPCVYEFLRVVTHPRVLKPPTPLASALDGLDALFESPSLVLLGEGPSHRVHLRRAMLAGRATGNLAHDAHIAALAIEHGVSEIWTTDRDFARFPGLKIRNPFEAETREPLSPYRTRRATSRR